MLGRSDAELGGVDLFSRLIRGLKGDEGEKGERLSEEDVINNVFAFLSSVSLTSSLTFNNRS